MDFSVDVVSEVTMVNCPKVSYKKKKNTFLLIVAIIFMFIILPYSITYCFFFRNEAISCSKPWSLGSVRFRLFYFLLRNDYFYSAKTYELIKRHL